MGTSHGNEYRGYGSLAFFFLILIMVVRPLTELFPNIVFFKKLMGIRRGIGITMGMAALTHGIGFFYQYPSQVGQSYIWSPTGIYLYGIIALFFTILLLVTSNNISVRFMGRKWKWLHKTVIILFYATCIHVALIGRNEAVFQVF
jgi:DMSO/TMAO reductase YedYZ heme-binding membrane subunit